jgi:plasmid maintenance system antidote protein VapI
MDEILKNPRQISPESFAEMIEKSGLKKKFVAKSIGIVPNHLYQFLSGNRKLSEKKLKSLEALLNTVNV